MESEQLDCELDINPNEICRACLSQDGELKNIFVSDILDGKIMKFPVVLEVAVDVKVTKDDGMPSKICHNCKVKINDIFVFKEKCKKSNDLLKSLFVKIPLTPPAPPPFQPPTPETTAIAETPNAENISVELDLPDPLYSASSDYIIDSASRIPELIDKSIDSEILNVNYLSPPNNSLDIVIEETMSQSEADGDDLEYLDEELEDNEAMDEDTINIKSENHSDDDGVVDDENIEDINEEVEEDDEVESYSLTDGGIQITLKQEVFSDGQIDETGIEVLECQLCGIEFYDKELLLEHIKLHSFEKSEMTINDASPTPLPKAKKARKQATVKTNPQIIKTKCCLCNVYLRGTEKYKHHMNCHIKTFPFIFDKIQLYRCGRAGCDLVFIDVTAFERHIRKEANSECTSEVMNLHDPESIITSDFNFPSESEDRVIYCASAAISASGEEIAFRCMKTVDCNFTGNELTSVVDHTNECHSTLLPNEEHQIYGCSKCEVWSENYHEILIHLYLHSEVFPCPFDICGEYERFYHLATHLEKSHVITQDEECTHCHEQFANYDELLRHLRNECKERNYECVFCSKKFLSQRSLSVHEKIHVNDKKHMCTFCGKKFIQSGDLKIHLRLHTGEKPYKCPLCPKRFRTTGNRQEHVDTHSSDKKFECPECLKMFKAERILKGHMNIHTGVKNYECDVCGKQFYRKSHVTSHMRTHNKKQGGNDSVDAESESWRR